MSDSISLDQIIDENSPVQPIEREIAGHLWSIRCPRSYMEARSIEKRARQWSREVLQKGPDGRFGAMLPEAQRSAIPEDIDLDGAEFAFRLSCLVSIDGEPMGLPDALKALRSARVCEMLETALENAGSRTITDALAADVAREKKESEEAMLSPDTESPA